jgi:hypothetical protein
MYICTIVPIAMVRVEILNNAASKVLESPRGADFCCPCFDSFK